MIRVPPGAVILDAAEVDYLARVLVEFASAMAPRSPSPKLLVAIDKLRRAGDLGGSLAFGDRVDDHQEPEKRQSKIASGRDGQQHSVHADPHDIATGAAARRLGITPNGVRDLARRGRLVARRTGGRWMVDAASVEAHAARKAARRGG